jgi:hypothetical protein
MDTGLFKFLGISALVIIIALAIAYEVQALNPPYKGYDFDTFMNDGPKDSTMRDIIVGLSFGTALGFVDTLGIWIGVEEISKYIKGPAKIKAAIGNLYSNLLGISVGTAVSVIMGAIIKPTNSQRPIYLTAVGSIIGALLGIYVGKTFF